MWEGGWAAVGRAEADLGVPGREWGWVVGLRPSVGGGSLGVVQAGAVPMRPRLRDWSGGRLAVGPMGRCQPASSGHPALSLSQKVAPRTGWGFISVPLESEVIPGTMA